MTRHLRAPTAARRGTRGHMTAAQLRSPARPAPVRDSTLQRGLDLLRQRRFDEAEFPLTAALAKNPMAFEALHFLAVLRLQQGREREALDLVSRALKQRSEAPEALALQATLRARIEPDQETLVSESVRKPATATTNPPPHWNGEYVTGTLLVSGYQGLGEQILCASMVPDLANYADRVVLEVEPRLVDLFARSFPHMRIVPRGAGVVSEADAQASMASLPCRLRPHWAAFPLRDQGFLTPDDARTAALRERVASDGRVVIGISWKTKGRKFANARSARLLDFVSVLRLPNCRFIDLQYGDTRAEREAVACQLGVHVEQLGDVDNSHDVDGLAALVAACDIVVTVSNTTAHLAGALGRPTWVFAPCGEARPWYWFEGLSDSPWYPYLTVRQQALRQSWADLIASSAAEIW
jgi:hypothetical protein